MVFIGFIPDGGRIGEQFVRFAVAIAVNELFKCSGGLAPALGVVVIVTGYFVGIIACGGLCSVECRAGGL